LADDEVGSLGQETLKLIRALAAEVPAPPQAGASDGGTHGAAAGSAHVCTTGWCPVCQVVGYVKANPDVVDEVAQAAVHLARTVRDAFDAALRHDGSRPADHPTPHPPEAQA
jgi:hypothetical protein